MMQTQSLRQLRWKLWRKLHLHRWTPGNQLGNVQPSCGCWGRWKTAGSHISDGTAAILSQTCSKARRLQLPWLECGATAKAAVLAAKARIRSCVTDWIWDG